MGADRKLRQTDRRYLRDLDARIAAWDPLGLIAGGAPVDEYDCLLSPIVSYLRAGLEPNEFAQSLRARIFEHFGLEPMGIDHFVADVIAWHGRLAQTETLPKTR